MDIPTFDPVDNILSDIVPPSDTNEDKLDNDIILLDDIYQSGTTIQFVAMKLIEAGAKRIFGLTTVKARRNTDNK